jgi:hypothetical protein
MQLTSQAESKMKTINPSTEVQKSQTDVLARRESYEISTAELDAMQTKLVGGE